MKFTIFVLMAVLAVPVFAKDDAAKKIPAHSKVFIAPMGGFEQDLKTAIERKKLPLELVSDRDKADFEITGTAETDKSGKAKKIIFLDCHSNEQASITITEIKNGTVV